MSKSKKRLALKLYRGCRVSLGRAFNISKSKLSSKFDWAIENGIAPLNDRPRGKALCNKPNRVHKRWLSRLIKYLGAQGGQYGIRWTRYFDYVHSLPEDKGSIVIAICDEIKFFVNHQSHPSWKGWVDRNGKTLIEEWKDDLVDHFPGWNIARYIELFKKYKRTYKDRFVHKRRNRS